MGGSVVEGDAELASGECAVRVRAPMSAVVALVVVAGGLFSLGGAAAAQSVPFGGTWSSTDLDGSAQTMVITLSATAGKYFVVLRDTGAAVCGGGRVVGSGSGTTGGTILTGTITLTCANGKQVPNVKFQLAYQAGDTLKDGLGVGWRREPAAPAAKGLAGTIVFDSNRSGDYEIYTMRARGDGLRRLTTAPGVDADPTWSRDGRKILFTSERDHPNADPAKITSEIYVMNADGSGQTRLTTNEVEDWTPRWSPNGKRIVFASPGTQAGYDFDVYVMNADGSGRQDLTPGPGRDFTPAWSPNGQRIAFASNDGGNYDVYVMNADGTGVTKLFSDQRDDHPTAWSPNGKRVAFQRYDPTADGNADVYTVAANGSDVKRLTNTLSFDCCGSWSPDGKRLLLSSERNGTSDLFVINADGSNVRLLLGGEAWESPGAWKAAAAASQDCTITGTAGADTLVGTAKHDVICGLGGNDVLKGYKGDDTLRGGPGNDTLIGGDGDDHLDGGAGKDVANGGPGRDVCKAEKRWLCESG
jgi:TolB protein